jgi:HSP20 family protein
MATMMTRWRPFTELEDLRRQMESAFGSGKSGRWSLDIDLIDRDDRYVLRANVPGLELDEVEIEVEDDVLTVSAEHEETTEEKRDEYVRRERRFGSFSRSIALPKGVTAEQVDATCKDGVLEVTFPKASEEPPKAVTIKAKAG